MTFRAPARDLAFALRTVGHSDLIAEAFPDLDETVVEAVLEAAGGFAENELAALNRVGDTIGAGFRDGRVIAAPGFADAYRAFAAGGWVGLSAAPEHGGQGMTRALESAVSEMIQGANVAFGLCPMLTQGAIEALSRHGSERQKRLVLPRLVSGEWTGTMNLTEPQAGSDLAAITTRAEPDGQGGYRLHGQKIFITWGDHDMAENICHLVLARLPDAPPGVKGISLFLAPKRLIDDDGRPGEMNALRAASIEHKLGIHGSPTCVMLFEGARAELVGEAHRGLAHMFVMMNAARLNVGVQGVGVAERAFQQALAFSQERRQGRSPWDGAYPAALYDLPDVRRTLLLMKARIEAARGICLTTAVLADLAEKTNRPEAHAGAKARLEMLTPIAKAWSTDMAVEVASMGLQIHGGMGFIEETGAAQHYRDARILPIYEGANAIQAIDLIDRKLPMQDGETLRVLTGKVGETVMELAGVPGLAGVSRRLALGRDALQAAADWALAHRGADALCGAAPFLRLAGDVIGGRHLARQALRARDADAPWLKAKVSLARIFAEQVLTQAPALAQAVMQGGGDYEAVEADALAG